MLGALGLLLLVAASSGDLSTPLRASARPSYCSPDAKAPPSGATPWEQVRQRSRGELCLALSRVQVQLLTQPRLALAAAGELARKWPARPEPLVLQARAQTRLGAFAEAWQLWQAVARGGYDFRSAHVLHDYAVAAAMNGQTELALSSYRRLLTLLSVWHDPNEQQRIYIEAAAAALRQGPSGLDEASGYLSAARTRAVSTGLRAYVASMQALVSELRGHSNSNAERIDAAEIWHFLGLIRSERPPAYWPVVPLHEASGAASLSIEKYSLAEAAELWQAYVQGLKETNADRKQQDMAQARARRLLGAVRVKP